MDDATRDKKGRFKKGHRASPNTEFKKGFRHSKETISKMKGRIPWNKGKKGLQKQSKELRKYRSKIAKEREYGKWMKGKKLSKETRKKIANHPNSKKTHFKSGEKHWNWNGGVTPERIKIWCSPEYKEWRNTVFDRDNYTCQNCLNMGGTLNAHHIKPFAQYESLRFVVSNGITLCENCHYRLHGRNYPIPEHGTGHYYGMYGMM